MSYQPQHRLNEFVPNYVPKSDFLPTNQVVDARQNEAQEVVSLPSPSSAATRPSAHAATSTASAPPISILAAT